MIIDDPDYEQLSRLAHQWRDRIQNDEVSDFERQAFQRWLAEDVRHEEAYDRALTFWSAYDHLSAADIDADLMPPSAASTERSAAFQSTAIVGATPFRLAGVAAAVFAIALLVVVAWERPPAVEVSPSFARYGTGVAETRTLTLEDGSTATLGAMTAIETVMSPETRVIRMNGGAAFFEVEPDPTRPFSVVSDEMTATALGTRFDVRHNGGVTRISVAEGTVEVAYPFIIGKHPTKVKTRRKLTAGQAVSATGDLGLGDLRSIPLEQVGAWRNHKLIYDGGTLGELVADANRYFPGTIVLADDAQSLADRTITGSFDADDTDRILRMLTLSFPVDIDRSDPLVLRIQAR